MLFSENYTSENSRLPHDILLIDIRYAYILSEVPALIFMGVGFRISLITYSYSCLT